MVSTIAVYLATAGHDFVYYDDPKYVTENTVVSSGLTRAGLAWAFTTGTDANWFPLTWLSHMLDVQLFGLNASGHHVTSVLLHALSTALLFLVLHKMTGMMWKSAFVAAMFALHPLHVESVAWIAERKDVLSTVFWMLTMLAYVRYTREPKVGRFILVAAVFALGLMSKPMLVTLPFVLLLIDFWPLRRLGSRSPGQLLVEKIPLIALAVASSITTFLVQRKGGAVGSLEAFPLALRVGNGLVSYLAYIRKTIWPSDLAAFYPYRLEVSAPAALVAAGVLAGLSILAVRVARKHPYVPVGWFWYVGTLVPVIGLIQVGNQAMADRYSYVPLIGLFIIAAWGFDYLAERWKFPRLVVPGLAIAATLGAALISWNQIRHWRNSAQLWTHALDVTTDNFVAHNNLGLALAGDGKVEEAISHYSEALRIRPSYGTARTNLGAALAKQGKLDEAISNYREALRIRPDLAEAHMDLGAALAGQGKMDDAIGHYRDAIRLKPGFAEAYANLGLAFSNQGQFDSAIAEYRKSIELKPSFAEAHNNLGFALASQGKFAESIDHYSEAIRYKPDFVLARINLGVSLANQDRVSEAMTAFREVIRLDPGNAMATQALSQLSSR